FTHQRWFLGIDRYRHRCTYKLFEHRQHTPPFLIKCNTMCSWTRRFAADINNVGALINQITRMRDRRLRRGKTAAIGKGVGRNVDHAHDQRTLERQPEFAALEKHARKRGDAEDGTSYPL